MLNFDSIPKAQYNESRITNILLTKIANDIHLLTQKIVFDKEPDEKITVPIEEHLLNFLEKYEFFHNRLSYNLQDNYQ